MLIDSLCPYQKYRPWYGKGLFVEVGHPIEQYYLVVTLFHQQLQLVRESVKVIDRLGERESSAGNMYMDTDLKYIKIYSTTLLWTSN